MDATANDFSTMTSFLPQLPLISKSGLCLICIQEDSVHWTFLSVLANSCSGEPATMMKTFPRCSNASLNIFRATPPPNSWKPPISLPSLVLSISGHSIGIQYCTASASGFSHSAQYVWDSSVLLHGSTYCFPGRCIPDLQHIKRNLFTTGSTLWCFQALRAQKPRQSLCCIESGSRMCRHG